MARAGYVPQARLFKAIDLENCIVDLGLGAPVLTDEMKAKALTELARRRGQSMTASKDTWDQVATFLADRFGPR